jgi:hypothetical protein
MVAQAQGLSNENGVGVQKCAQLERWDNLEPSTGFFFGATLRGCLAAFSPMKIGSAIKGPQVEAIGNWLTMSVAPCPKLRLRMKRLEILEQIAHTGRRRHEGGYWEICREAKDEAALADWKKSSCWSCLLFLTPVAMRRRWLLG